MSAILKRIDSGESRDIANLRELRPIIELFVGWAGKANEPGLHSDDAIVPAA